jgi:hypothetical protein
VTTASLQAVESGAVGNAHGFLFARAGLTTDMWATGEKGTALARGHGELIERAAKDFGPLVLHMGDLFAFGAGRLAVWRTMDRDRGLCCSLIWMGRR